MDQKRKILFVDDDPLIIRGFRRFAEEYTDHWNIFFSTSGQDALTILGQYPMDVLITDMRMPLMDGNRLLELVSQNFPGVIRFVLSGNAEDSRLIEASSLAHQFIAKPCEMNLLMQTVEQACQVRSLLTDPQLINVVTSLKKLPSVPALYTQLMREMESDEPSPKVVGNIISQDTAMTAKILQLVNSAFFGLPSKISDPQKAVNILGIDTVKALVLSIQIFSEYQGYASSNFSIDRLWKHSIQVGRAARSICTSARLDAQTQANAQIVGVLHDIGKLVQLSIPNFLNKVKSKKGKVLLASEYQVLGTSHAEIGAYLLGIWGLPQYIIEAVVFHHRPAAQISTKFNLISALHISNSLCHMLEYPESDDFKAFLDMDYLTTLGVVNRIDEWYALCKQLNETGET